MENSIMLQAKQVINSSGRGDISQFQTIIQHNYNLAIAHYDMYVQQIIQSNRSKSIQIDDNLLKKLAAELSKVVINWAYDSITLEKIYNNGNLEQDTATILNLKLTPELINTLKSNQDWSTGKGFVFEEYIHQKLSLKQFVEKNSSISAHNAVGNTLQELLQPLISNIETTGQTRSPSYLRQGNPYIRADLANTKDFENSELRLEFALTKQHDINELEATLFQTSSLQELMQELHFGYSLKSYAYPTTNSIMQVSGLQNILNNMFNKSNDKTWNLNYAYYAMLEQISNLLLNIFGPLNIGFFFANGFYWTSTILEQNQAIMHIYGNPVSDIATQNLEIYQPHIYSNNLYLARIKLNNLSNLTTQFRLNTNYSKKSGNIAYYIQARIL